MKFKVGALAVAMLVLGLTTAAATNVYNGSNVMLGSVAEIKCSTGVTCAVSGKRLTVTSSSLTDPITLSNGEIINNTVDDKVEILSDDNHTTLQITGFEAKDAILNLYSDQGDDAADKFRIRASAADVLSFDNNGTAFASFDSSGNLSVTGSVTGDGGDALSGFLQAQVAATATTITASQCGSTFYNSGAVVINLPAGAAGLLGCRLTFVTMNASNFDINPGNSDQILLLTDAAGDAIRNATIGNTVVLQYVATNKWVDVSHIGTWSDVN